jgi:hypothetical protein
MLTDDQLTELERRMAEGEGLNAALKSMLKAEPSLELLTWLRDNQFEKLTAAKKAGTLKIKGSTVPLH